MEKGHTQVSAPNCDPRHWGREKSLPKLQIWMKIDEWFCFKALNFGGVFFFFGWGVIFLCNNREMEEGYRSKQTSNMK